MQIKECPKCKLKMLKIYTIGGEDKTTIDFSLINATETVICKNCGKKVSYSVKKNEKGEQNGRN